MFYLQATKTNQTGNPVLEKNLFFLWIRGLALCPHFHTNHFLPTVIKVNGYFRALCYYFHSGGGYQGWPHFSSWCSLFLHYIPFLENVLFYLIIASCPVWITPCVVVLLIRPLSLSLTPWVLYAKVLVMGTSFPQGFDSKPRSRQMRMHP